MLCMFLIYIISLFGPRAGNVTIAAVPVLQDTEARATRPGLCRVVSRVGRSAGERSTDKGDMKRVSHRAASLGQRQCWRERGQVLDFTGYT